jgi:hypothetical protein
MEVIFTAVFIMSVDHMGVLREGILDDGRSTDSEEGTADFYQSSLSAEALKAFVS